MKVKLKDGTVLESAYDGRTVTFPPLQKIKKVDCACEICPLRQLCQDNNEFDCQVYGMFSGFHVEVDQVIQLLRLDIGQANSLT